MKKLNQCPIHPKNNEHPICHLCSIVLGFNPIHNKFDKQTRIVKKELELCPELGPPLRDEELIKLGFDLEQCGCTKKIRLCNLHEFCTTGEPREGIKCCASCDDHPSKQT